MTEKFKKQSGETVLMKGNLSHPVGEAGVKNFFTGKYRVTECTVFLTNQRLVATKARKYGPPFGPLVWLIRAFFARSIVFSIGHGELAAIKLDPARKREMRLVTTGGQEFALTCTGFFDKQPQWLDAITSAVRESAPGTVARKTDSGVTFQRSAKSAAA